MCFPQSLEDPPTFTLTFLSSLCEFGQCGRRDQLESGSCLIYQSESLQLINYLHLSPLLWAELNYSLFEKIQASSQGVHGLGLTKPMTWMISISQDGSGSRDSFHNPEPTQPKMTWFGLGQSGTCYSPNFNKLILNKTSSVRKSNKQRNLEWEQ